MRALPVHQDTIDLLVTDAFISSPDTVLQTPESLAIFAAGRDSMRVLAGADQIGQLLWDENQVGRARPVERSNAGGMDELKYSPIATSTATFKTRPPSRTFMATA